MSDRETNIRSVFFLVIGILLLLSLIVCIYIVNSQSDLVNIDATVTKVTKDVDGTGKNEVQLVYPVGGENYLYKYNTTDELNVDDTVSIYYHKESPTSVTSFKVSKTIFLFPAAGLVLCIIGLYELFKKRTNDDGEDEFKTSVIGVVGDTQQLKIVTDDTEVKEYKKTPEEKVEVGVKTIKKEVEEPVVSEVVVPVPEPVPEVKVEQVKVEEKEVVVPEVKQEAPKPVAQPKPVMVEANAAEMPAVKKEVQPVKQLKEEAPSVPPVPKAPAASQMTDAIVKKVQSNIASTPDGSKVSIDEDDIKQVIKNVLKEVIQEVKEEKEPPKKVEQKRVLPNYYYISGTSLIYEEPGKEAKEISLKTVKKVVRTVNSEGNVVKLIVSNEEVKCILTNMKNIDLEQVASLLNNKMRTIDETFKEEIEYKEY